MNTCKAKAYLNSFFNFEKNLNSANPAKFKLKRVEHLLEHLGSPHQQLNVIHVAGTNGKGSVCAYTASILSSAGYKVGLYTSPHLVDLNERIRVIGPNDSFDDPFCGSISDTALDELVGEIRERVEEVRCNKEYGRITYFEVLTALALYYFVREKVDFVVLETGLGGRLDATNACPSKVAAITHIGVEHKKFLGETLPQIASEKAAIIKDEQQNVVLAPQSKEALKVLNNRCRAYGIIPYVVGEDVVVNSSEQKIDGQSIFLRTRQFGSIEAKSHLVGDCQAVNAATAVGIIEEMLDYLPLMSASTIKDGIERVRWPGRFEVLQSNPLVILDGAHNPSSAQALKHIVQTVLGGRQVVLVLGVSNDKDIAEMMPHFCDMSDEVVITQADHHRSLTVDNSVWNSFMGEKLITKVKTVKEAVDLAKSRVTPGGAVLITGSFFILGEVKGTCTNIKV